MTNKNHFEFMVKDSKFPKLRLLNYTSIGLTEVPLELRESRRKFPGSQLGVIDLSHNYIRGLGAIPPYPARGVPTTLILQFNNITDISTQLFQEWALVPDYYVDIRNNPIDCGCDLKDLLIQMDNATMWAAPSMAYYRRHLSVMTCATPPGLSGRAIGSLSVDDLPCPVAGADLRPAMAALVVVVIILLLMLVLAVKYRKEVRGAGRWGRGGVGVVIILLLMLVSVVQYRKELRKGRGVGDGVGWGGGGASVFVCWP